jgi:predicted transcriptional regulator of viral defense system
VLRIFRCESERLLDDTIQPIIEGAEVRITNVPRTITDCFRHRRAIGLDVAILALREAIQRRLCTPADLALVAKKHRAWNIMRPYLEALL